MRVTCCLSRRLLLRQDFWFRECRRIGQAVKLSTWSNSVVAPLSNFNWLYCDSKNCDDSMKQLDSTPKNYVWFPSGAGIHSCGGKMADGVRGTKWYRLTRACWLSNISRWVGRIEALKWWKTVCNKPFFSQKEPYIARHCFYYWLNSKRALNVEFMHFRVKRTLILILKLYYTS